MPEACEACIVGSECEAPPVLDPEDDPFRDARGCECNDSFGTRGRGVIALDSEVLSGAC